MPFKINIKKLINKTIKTKNKLIKIIIKNIKIINFLNLFIKSK
jgi:hypothetical protein